MPSPPSYAPTTHTSYGPATGNHVKYHQEISKSSLIELSQHRQVLDDLAEIFSILQVLELVEKSFLKDYLTDKDKYTLTVLRLINQFLIILKSMELETYKQIVRKILPSIATDNLNFLHLFLAKFNLSCPLAIKRIDAGIPATIETLGAQIHSQADGGIKSARLVAEATGNYITCMDALKLDYNTKAQLHPLLSNLVVSLNDLVILKAGDVSQSIDFPGKLKLVSWLIKLNGLGENEELTSKETDHFLEDLEDAYKGFYTSLEN